MKLDKLIKVAEGKERADTVLKNAKIINVASCEIYEADLAISEDKIAGIGKYKGKKEVNLKGMYLAPGFIDGHIHIESSKITISEFAKTVIPLGTTTVVIDPHEIANVLGLDGIKYFINSAEGCLLDVYIMLPSCVPATHLETSGANLRSTDLKLLLNEPRVLGLGEMMNYPGVLAEDREILKKIRLFKDKIIDGHAPSLTGKELCGYIAAGIHSDHECTTVKEAKEKLRMGMHIMIREGSAAQNLKDILPLVNYRNSRFFFFVTDDRNPHDLIEKGHINYIVKSAVKQGLPPILAIQMATINTAEYFNLRNIGMLAPGMQADIVVMEDLKKMKINRVYKKGELVAESSRTIKKIQYHEAIKVRGSVNVKWLELSDFRIKAKKSKANVINIIPNQIVTKKTVEKIKKEKSLACADPKRDILKIAVIERHMASGRIGLGFVKGFGLKKGAIASSVAHDSHNIIVAGTNDEDMLFAAVAIVKMQGGQVVVADNKILEALPLPVAGLISRGSVEEVRNKSHALTKKARQLGCGLEDPFTTLSFLALPPIPEIKLTDRGLVDVAQFKIIPLFV
ncbi:MAG: adenine deaminase [Armatimonadota bacterium]